MSEIVVKDNKPLNNLIKYADSQRWDLGENFHDLIVESIFSDANKIASKVISNPDIPRWSNWEISLDKIVTSRWLGFPAKATM